jgi:integrase
MPLWRDPKNGKYRYQFQYRGRRYSKTGFATQKAAQTALVKHRESLETNPVRPSTPTVMGFKEMANLYLDYTQRRFAEKTHKYKVFVYREFLRNTGDLPLDRISSQVIEKYLCTRPTNVNYNRHRKDLSALFAWVIKRGYLAFNPCSPIDRMPEPEFRRQVPTTEEMTKILLASGPNRPFLLILYHTLARVDEILRLRWDDVNFSQRTVRLWTRKRKDGSWHFDILPMNDDLYEVLWALWKKKGHPEWVFPNPKTGDRFYYRRRIMRSTCKRAGVRPFGYHAIRHYVASLLADREKVGITTVSRLLRHQSIRTTEIYLHAVDDGLRQAMGRLENKNLNLLTDLLTVRL